MMRQLPILLGLAVVANAGELFDITKEEAALEKVMLAGVGQDKLLAVSRALEGGVAIDAKRGAILIPFESVSLEKVGSSVEVAYKALFLNIDGSSRNFRVGLLGLAEGLTITEHQAALVSKVFAGAGGYFMNARLASKSNAQSEFFRRNPDALNLFPGGESTVLGVLTEGLDVSNGTEYQGKFSVSRTGANEVTVTHEFDGRMAQVAVDGSDSPWTDFNLFTLFLSNAKSDDTASRILFSELKISSKP